MISDTDIRILMPKNFRKMTDRYKHMCGCKIYVIIFSMKALLNRYRLDYINILREQAMSKGGWIARSGVDATKKYNSYANDVYPNNQYMHFNPRDTLLVIKLNPVDEFSVPHLRCVLQQSNMCLDYCINQHEMVIKKVNDQNISF